MTSKRHISQPDDLRRKLERFMVTFEAVFADPDWEITRGILANPEHFIRPDGTFLEPGVDNESANWANRGSMLSAYRALKAEMEGLKRREIAHNNGEI